MQIEPEHECPGCGNLLDTDHDACDGCEDNAELDPTRPTATPAELEAAGQGRLFE